MSIGGSYAPQRNNGDGTTRAFTVPFVFLAPGDLKVMLYDTVAGALVSPAPVLNGAATYDYTVTGTPDPNTGEYPSGTVTFNNAPAATYTVIVARATPQTQQNSFPSNAKLPGPTIEATADKLELQLQEVDDDLGRALVAPITDASVTMALPPASARAGFLLGWNSGGTPKNSDFSEAQIASYLQSVAQVEGYVALAQAAAQSSTQATLQPRVLWTDFSTDPANAASNVTKLNAFLNTCAAIGAVVCIPANAGSIPFSAQIDIPNGGGLVYEVARTAKLVFSEGTYPNNACIYAGGSFTALPALSADISLSGATSIVLASAPSDLAAGDYLFLCDKATLYNGARSFYYEGEAVEVLSVAGSTIELASPLFTAYKSASTKVSKLNSTTVTLDGLDIVGPGAGIQVNAFLIDGGRNCVVRNVSTGNTDYTGGQLAHCVESLVDNCHLSKLLPDNGAGLSYGLAITNCQNILISRCTNRSTRHAGTVGGSDTDQGITNRFIVWDHCYFSHSANSDAAVEAANLHGNVEFCGFVDCHADGGVNLAGDQVYFVGGTVRGGSFYGLSSSGLNTVEAKGPNHIFHPDLLLVRGANPSNQDYGLACNFGQTGSGFDAHTTVSGTFVFWPKLTQYTVDGGAAGGQSIISINNFGSTAAVKIVIGGDYQCGGIGDVDFAVATVNVNSGSNIDTVDVRGVTGNLAFNINHADTVLAAGADLDATGLCASGVATPFNTGAAFAVFNAVNVDAIGLRGRGGRGDFLRADTLTSVDTTGLYATGYSGVAIHTSTVTRARIIPGDIGGLGITLTETASTLHVPGLNDGALTLSDATAQAGYTKIVPKTPPLELTLGGTDLTGLTAGSANKIPFTTLASTYGIYWDGVNFKFLPTCGPSRWRFILAALATGSAGTQGNSVRIYKNGAVAKVAPGVNGLSSASSVGSAFSVELDLNGSTDYVEPYCFMPAGFTTISGAVTVTYLQIERVW